MFRNKKLAVYSLLFCLISLLTYLLFFPTKKVNIQKTSVIESKYVQEKTSAKIVDLANKSNSSPSSPEKLADSDYIVDCTESIELAEDNTSQQFSDYLLTLNKSNKTEDQLAQLIQSPRSETKNDLTAYFDLFKEEPRNKLIYSRILKLCISQFDENLCNEKLYDQAFQVDKANAMLWHSIAAIKLKKEDIDGVVSALNEANSKKNYDNYYFQHVNFIEQNLKANSYLNFRERMSISTGIKSEKFSSLSPIMDFCKKNYFSQIEITDVCYQTAKQLELQSNTEIPRLVALILQRTYHEFYQNNQAIDNIENKIKKLVSFVKSSNYQNTYMLIPFDERLARNWLALSLNSNENDAMELLIQDAIFYSRDRNYNPCPINN